MNSPEDVKLHAKKLCKILADMNYSIGHGKCLEILSKLNGYTDWNTYCASLRNNSRISEVTEIVLLPLPTGWTTSGDNLEGYEIGLDPNSTFNGKRPAVIRAKDNEHNNISGFATLMQTCIADKFIGKRIELRAKIRAENCEGAVTLWLRADSEISNRHLAFDNMETRTTDGPLTGSTQWETRTIVLDIPEGTVRLAYGFYLRGSGSGYAADFSIEEVNFETEVTSTQPTPLAHPTNLGFENIGN